MTEHIREEYALPPGVHPGDSLAHRLVMAAQNASQDCGCGPNEFAIVAAVLREMAAADRTQLWRDRGFVALDLDRLADEIEPGRSDG